MPFVALALLIFETKNDFVRFHGMLNSSCPASSLATNFLAYQSALLVIPLIVLRIFAALVHFPSWLQTLCTLLLVLPMLYMACVYQLIAIATLHLSNHSVAATRHTATLHIMGSSVFIYPFLALLPKYGCQRSSLSDSSHCCSPLPNPLKSTDSFVRRQCRSVHNVEQAETLESHKSVSHVER